MKLIVFDIDGTLIDSEKQIFEAQCRAFSALGLVPPSRERCRSMIGLSLAEAFEGLVGRDGPTTELVEAYRAARVKMREEGLLELPFPGAAEILEVIRLWPEVRLGVATGKPRHGVTQTFKRLGWDAVFTTTQTADDGPSKPDPTILLKAIREAGAETMETILVGDTTFDVEMAKRANVQCAGVAWGNHAASDLRSAGASWIAHTFDDLVDRLRSFAIAPLPTR